MAHSGSLMMSHAMSRFRYGLLATASARGPSKLSNSFWRSAGFATIGRRLREYTPPSVVDGRKLSNENGVSMM